MKRPDFLIIGAHRSGTTSLYNYLTAHSKVLRARSKEIHFFDNYFKKGIKWYFSNFSKNKGTLTGEATPNYLWHPLVPKRVKTYLPEIKLIVILRNPIDRAYSHYQRNIYDSPRNWSFKEALKFERENVTKELELLRTNSNRHSRNFTLMAFLTIGKYEEQLKRWFNFFSREQFLILSFEEFFRGEREFKKLLSFLELGEEIPRILKEGKKFHKGGPSSYPPMLKEERKKLRKFFKPYNEKLYQLLGKDFGWD